LINTSFNVAKNVNGESVNKLTTSELIAHNVKIPTNNVIKTKMIGIPIPSDLQH